MEMVIYVLRRVYGVWGWGSKINISMCSIASYALHWTPHYIIYVLRRLPVWGPRVKVKNDQSVFQCVRTVSCALHWIRHWAYCNTCITMCGLQRSTLQPFLVCESLTRSTQERSMNLKRCDCMKMCSTFYLLGREVMFLVALVCLSLSNIAKKIMNRLRWNFMEGSGVVKGTSK